MEKSNRRALILRITLGVIVILILVARFFRKDYQTVFMCILTLLLFTIPKIVDKRFNIDLPNTLENIIILFIFSAEILGEIGSFYTYIHWWDTMLHTVNGFLMAAIGFAMIDILNNSPRFHITMSPIFVAFVAFCFSMTIGVIWEFFEFSMDFFFHTDMQKDFFQNYVSSVALNPNGINDPVILENITNTVVNYTKDGTAAQYLIENGFLDTGIADTMKDLIVNCIGAIVFSVIGYFYIVGREKGGFAKKFIPQLKNKN